MIADYLNRPQQGKEGKVVKHLILAMPVPYRLLRLCF